MRKSGKVFLSAVFAAAVTAGKAQAQQQQQDTTSSRRPYAAGHSGHGFFSWFHFGRRSSGGRSNGTRAEISSTPRNGGFGNSLRTSSAS